jgi:hypothetical protein
MKVAVEGSVVTVLTVVSRAWVGRKVVFEGRGIRGLGDAGKLERTRIALHQSVHPDEAIYHTIDLRGGQPEVRISATSARTA